MEDQNHDADLTEPTGTAESLAEADQENGGDPMSIPNSHPQLQGAELDEYAERLKKAIGAAGRALEETNRLHRVDPNDNPPVSPTKEMWIFRGHVLFGGFGLQIRSLEQLSQDERGCVAANLRRLADERTKLPPYLDPNFNRTATENWGTVTVEYPGDLSADELRGLADHLLASRPLDAL